jgi:hypothetical protein
MDSFRVDRWDPSGICTYNGYKTLSSVHTFTTTDIACMSKSEMSGELTLYVKNEGTGTSAVVLAVITKSRNAFVFANFYQALGNLISLTVSTSGSSTVDMTFSPPVEVRWIFRGA